MDKRLEKALEFSNFRMILAARQENLKLLMNNKLMLSYGGGMFKIDKELLSFVLILMVGDSKKAILIDANDIPIKIDDLEDFIKQAGDKYEKAIQQYYKSYQKLSEAREIRKVIDWDEKEDS